MTQEVFANNASTTLGSALSSTATIATVATGTGNTFPAIGPGQFFSATLVSAGNTTGLPNEIVYVTARSGDTFTIERAQEGTTAAAWNIGDSIANLPTAAFLNGLLQTGQLQSQTGNSATDSGTANAAVIALNPAIASLSSILLSPIRVLKMASNNTGAGAYSINVNGLGAERVTINGNNLQPNQLLSNQVFVVVWDGTNFELISNTAQIYANQIAGSAVTSAAIAGSAVGSAQIAAASVTSTAIAGSAVGTAQIAAGAVTNTELAQMGADTLKGNLTGATAYPSDVSLSVLAAALASLTTLFNPAGTWTAYNSSNRVFGVTYYNTEAYGIFANVAAGNSGGAAVVTAVVDGVTIGGESSNYSTSTTFLYVPGGGGSYSVSTTSSPWSGFNHWAEFA